MKLLREIAQAVFRNLVYPVLCIWFFYSIGLGLLEVSKWVFGKEAVEGTGWAVFHLLLGIFGVIGVAALGGYLVGWLESYRRRNRKPD